MKNIKNKIPTIALALAFLALYFSPAMALTFTEIKQGKVLGNVEYAPVRLNSIFTTFRNVSVKAKDFSNGKWKFVIDWSRVRNAHGSIYILPVGQSEPVFKLDDVSPQDSAETGYVFSPQTRYKLEFYSDINKDGKLLLRKFFTTLKAPEIACTMEAKICPDGSSVSRAGLNCEFPACPTETRPLCAFKNPDGSITLKHCDPAQIRSDLKVTSPNGGEVWAKGSTQTIRWEHNFVTTMQGCALGSNCPAPPAPFFDIKLLSYDPPCASDPCPMYARMPIERKIAEGVPGDSYNWTIPNCSVGNECSSNFEVPAGNYVINVCRSGTDICDLSDNYFTVGSKNFIEITTSNPLSLVKGNRAAIAFVAYVPITSSGTYVPRISFTETGNVPGMSFVPMVCFSDPTVGIPPMPCDARPDTIYLAGTPTTLGSYPITITAKDQDGHSGSQSFTVVVAEKTSISDVPVINNLNPNSGVGETLVTINGTGFTPTGNAVKFNGSVVMYPSLSSADSKTLQFRPVYWYPITPCPTGMACDPAPIAPGVYKVTVTNTNGTSNAVDFTLTDSVLGSGNINITSPKGGEQWALGSTHDITWDPTGIEGANLDISLEQNGVNVGSIGNAMGSAGKFAWTINGNKYNITPGKYKVVITAPSYLGMCTNSIPPHCSTTNLKGVSGEFSVVSSATAPIISSITPTIGSMGTMVTIKGSGFYEGSRVSFGNSSLGSQSSVANVVDGQIKFVIPREIIPPGPNCQPPMYCASPAPREVGLGDYEIFVSNSFGTSNKMTFTVNSLTFAVCDYAAPPIGCSYVSGPNFNPVTQCGMVLSCPANNGSREP